MLGKVRAMINKLQSMLVNTVWFKGFGVSFQGQGVADPLISNGYNVESITRTGVGVYTVTPTQSTFFGVSIIENSFPTISYAISPSAETSLFIVGIIGSGGDATITVKAAIQGAGNQIDVVPYDLVAGDFISATLLLTVGTGELPPQI